MKLLHFLIVLLVSAAACSPGSLSSKAGLLRSELIPLAEIFIEGTSQQAEAEYLYFRVTGEERCAGIRLRHEGFDRYISFVRTSEEPSVDSKAILTHEPSWEGMQRVEVPIDPEVLAHGGTMHWYFEDGHEVRDGGGHGYPSPTPKD